ncbi:hypothetical protein POM88_011409 [Heracleum sosnowskyi]|uniref:Late embryogenesis abundant protein LEA-2 subgroup domain-containing protein n=1 Tax=Heracleum sosnowskyi TaxID=360622 RepID=A0AAD8IWS1_9APIA|nr:hypothetical protein POM88_011409 [Heracleum sosnowskyi]
MNMSGKKLCWAAMLVVTFTLLLAIVLIAWLVLTPTKPQFILQNATVNNFRYFSDTNLLTSGFRISLFFRNPSSNVGFYCDQFQVFATYRGEQITLTTPVPATYQGQKDVSIWSVSLTGSNVPLGLQVGDLLVHDQTDGTVLIDIKV